MSRSAVLRSWLVTVALVLVCSGFTGFVAVVVSGHASPEFTAKVRQTVRDSVNRVLLLLPGHPGAPGG